MNESKPARVQAFITHICPMCEDCPDGCPITTPKDSKNAGCAKEASEEIAAFDKVLSDNGVAKANVEKVRKELFAILYDEKG